MLSFWRRSSKYFTKPVKDAVRPVVTRTADPSEKADQALKDVSANSKKSKVQWRRSEATVDVVETQMEDRVTPVKELFFCAGNDNNESASLV